MAAKKETVRQMFDDIAPRYDFLNHFLSMGIDRSWRKRVVREIRTRFAGHEGGLAVLDVATGTADLAIAISAIRGSRITGIDISADMLAIGRKKVAAKGLQERITLHVSDAEHIPFDSGSFDAVTVAFGVRNFENLDRGLAEMYRVLKPGGYMMILEFSHPDRTPFRQLYTFYSKYIIPLFGRMISRHEGAYTYLPESVEAFPSGNAFLEIMKRTGVEKPLQIRLTQGIASLYIGQTK